ncbi:MAG: molybdopterin-dependent oxidoreductase, partial [Chlorobi bacterium]|nr:molybdopterin-dependent oxidoreductase [Chlorobiota bacterium]
MKNIDSSGHLRGESIYVDDIRELGGTLHAVPLLANVAHAKILNVDYSKAKKSAGIIEILTAKDIPGENQIGGIFNDEVLLAEDEVHFIGQTIAVIVAESHFEAREALHLIDIEYQGLEIITDPRIAKEKGSLLFPARTFKNGDIEKAFADCEYVFSGKADSGGQEHLYIETHASYAIPQERDNIKIYSSTQGPTAVQKTVARVLGLSMHNVEVDVTRLGGAFGGKEDQATAWAVMAALAARKLHKPVKLVLDRIDDIIASGKRHPYSSDFKIGLDKSLKIKAYKVTYYQNGGAVADLSPAILERTLFHVANSYFIPNVEATAYSCKTNLHPFTAFRGFGGPQAMFVIESAIALSADMIGVEPRLIQEKNLFHKNDSFHYGQSCDSNNAIKSWKSLFDSFRLESEIQRLQKFNDDNIFIKKGFSLMPVCFGISFTKTPMNQARAMVHVYQDGSVGISTGAVEMGQGVNTKLMQVAAKVFSVDIQRIKIEPTNTSRVANTSPTAASTGADLNGKAVLIACREIRQRLEEVAVEVLGVNADEIDFVNGKIFIGAVNSGLSWEKLVETAFLKRVKLSEIGHYATPIIYFDNNTEKGHPFAYHVFGTAYISVILDSISGVYKVEDVKIVHDFGNSMNIDIDKGQVEGALMQGIGWMTMEELKYDESGKLLADSLSKYKVPDIFSTPKNVDILELGTEGPELAILKSKAVGEPPLMYGIGAYFALRNAVR